MNLHTKILHSLYISSDSDQPSTSKADPRQHRKRQSSSSSQSSPQRKRNHYQKETNISSAENKSRSNKDRLSSHKSRRRESPGDESPRSNGRHAQRYTRSKSPSPVRTNHSRSRSNSQVASQNKNTISANDSKKNSSSSRLHSSSPEPVAKHRDSNHSRLNRDNNTKMVDDVIEGNLKEIRKQPRVEGSNSMKENSQQNTKKTDEERFPHHNSAKDIQEARKRYLQRKIARERAMNA